MVFDIVLGMECINEANRRVNHREAIRAVIINDDKVLLVHCNKGDYKFPGGGIQQGEEHSQTLKREVEEETGFMVSSVEEMVGRIVQRNIDAYDNDAIFEMISYYYLCNVYDDRKDQALDEYEKELDFKPVWVTLDEAIFNNENLLLNEKAFKNPWVYRETMVMKRLRNTYWADNR